MSTKTKTPPPVPQNESQTVIWVDPSKVKTRENFNPRIQPFTEDIKPSIIEHGVRESVEAVDNGDGTYTLNAQGHRRLLALIELHNEKFTTTKIGNKPLMMPLRIVAAPKDQKDLLIDILTLNTGKPLEMLETARVYGQMIGEVIDPKARREAGKEIAKQTGRSINAIMNYLLLLECGPVITKLLENGQANGSLVIDLYLAGPCKGDWAKVETAVVEAVANAAASGKTKADKRDVAGDKKDATKPAGEGEAGTPAAANGDVAAKAADEAEKAEQKADKDQANRIRKSVMRFSDYAVALDRTDKSGVEIKVIDLVQIAACVFYPEAKADLKLEGDFSFGDINANVKAIIRAAIAEKDDLSKALAAQHKGEIAQLKIAHKAELEKAAVDLTAAQAQVKALTPKKA